MHEELERLEAVLLRLPGVTAGLLLVFVNLIRILLLGRGNE
jgi:hypothetical protein